LMMNAIRILDLLQRHWSKVLKIVGFVLRELSNLLCYFR